MQDGLNEGWDWIDGIDHGIDVMKDGIDGWEKKAKEARLTDDLVITTNSF